MTVSASLIFPGVTPVGAGADDGERRVGDGGLTACSFEQDFAIISGAQPTETEFGGSEVIDASLQVGQFTANQIELNFVASGA